MHHFDIHMAVDCDQTRVFMDGRPLDGVHAFRVECAKGGVTRITLELSGTASIDGEGQVWVKDNAQHLSDRADAADNRASAADDRATAAEARADAAEAMPGIDTSAATLAYIVPVPTDKGSNQ